MELPFRTNEQKPATGADCAHFRLRVRSIAYSRLSVDAKEPAAGADIVVADVGVRGMAQSLHTNVKNSRRRRFFPFQIAREVDRGWAAGGSRGGSPVSLRTNAKKARRRRRFY